MSSKLASYRKFFSESIKQVFVKRPIAANTVIYGSLYISAELSQQVLNKKILAETKEPLDLKSLSRFAFLGVVVYPPFYYYWYRWLDGRFLGASAAVIGKKLLVDQFMMAPLNIIFFYTAMSAMEGKSDLLKEAREKTVDTFKVSCYFWVPAQILNFAVIPSAARVAYVGTCMFAWVNILCWFKRQEVKEE